MSKVVDGALGEENVMGEEQDRKGQSVHHVDGDPVFAELDKLRVLYERYERISKLYELAEIEQEVEVQLHDWSTPLGLVVKKRGNGAILE